MQNSLSVCPQGWSHKNVPSQILTDCNIRYLKKEISRHHTFLFCHLSSYVKEFINSMNFFYLDL